MNSKIGVNGLFYILGFIQVVAFFILNMVLKETKGLTQQEKKMLYAPAPDQSMTEENR